MNHVRMIKKSIFLYATEQRRKKIIKKSCVPIVVYLYMYDTNDNCED